ncbi:MAG: hypothetical protein HXS53_03345 [Theionarchaea archaeon]|nr:hypothetical protein [Theionarchaea archaeon]
MKRLTDSDKRYLKYQIFYHRFDDPWISNKKVAKRTAHSISTVNRYAHEAEDEHVLTVPQAYLKPHPEINSALLQFEDKHKAFNILKAHPRVGYLCIFHGSWDVMVSYNGTIDFTDIPGYRGEVTMGYRGIIHTPRVPFTTWQSALKKIDTILSQEEYEQELFFTQIPCTPDWDEEEWHLFYYFTHNLRKSFNDLRKRIPISWRKFEAWKKSLFDYCVHFQAYYPEGYDAYNIKTFCFQTDYETFIVDLFSHLPATPVFSNVGDHILLDISVPNDHLQQVKIFELISQLIEKDIISHCIDGYTVIEWSRTDMETLHL